MTAWQALQENWARIPPGTVPALVVLGSLLVGLYVTMSVLLALYS
jgi:hypothetical protein